MRLVGITIITKSINESVAISYLQREITLSKGITKLSLSRISREVVWSSKGYGGTELQPEVKISSLNGYARVP